MHGAHALDGPDQAADLGDPLEHYPLPALRAGSDGAILYANRAARRLAARLSGGPSALLPEYHDKYLAAALAEPGETVTACARFYDAATVLQWSYALAPDGHGVAMFAADVGGYALLSESIADPQKNAPSAYDSLLRRFIEHVPVAAAMFDRDMRYLLASRRWRSDFGFLPERLEGKCHYDLVDVPPEWRERHRRALAGEDMPPVEISLTRPDTGRVEWMITQALPWTREDGLIGGILIFAHIITARKEAEAEAESRQASLQHQQKMEALGTLAGGIAHEINSPIQYISDNLGFLSGTITDLSGLVSLYREALAASAPPPEMRLRIAEAEAAIDLPFLASESGDAVAQALSGVRAISRIVTAIKTFSHPGQADPLPVDINSVIRDAVVVSRNQWKPVAEVEEDLDDTMPLILGHGDQLGQVVLNLIVNAMHAIEDANRAGRGRIRLSSRA
ncbi:MAG: PAS domain-containing protein, partial [Rhodospirillaceae bacterium]